jgi:hypothetical protein
MMKIAVVGATGPTGIRDRARQARIAVSDHSCDSSHSFPPFAQVTFQLVNGQKAMIDLSRRDRSRSIDHDGDGKVWGSA